MGIDVFPVDVTVGDTRYRECRVRVTDGTARLFGMRAGQPVQLAAGPISDEPDGRRQVTRIGLADGGAWDLVRSGGCGCHSPLKRMSGAVLAAVAADADRAAV
ncbi:MAG: hypothetical protein ACRDXE_11050 [Acidimicrobiales bacterium]